jgi:ankyrin repeat protein
MSANACDMHGNTAVHQAAASGSDEVVKCFLSRGVDVNRVNAREHTPLQLATKDETRDLIVKALDTKRCSGGNCNNSVFDFQNIRYFCGSCQNFFCSKCSTKSWVYENKSSTLKERPVCRCDNCAKEIDQS